MSRRASVRFKSGLVLGIVFTGGRVHSERLSCKIARTQCDIYCISHCSLSLSLVFIEIGGSRNLRTRSRDAIGIYSRQDSNIAGSSRNGEKRERGRRNPLKVFVRLILFFRNLFSICYSKFHGINVRLIRIDRNFFFFRSPSYSLIQVSMKYK